MAKHYTQWDAMLCTLIFDVLIPNRCDHGFPIGWEDVLIRMRQDKTVFTWGPYLLGMLYHQLHEVAYREASSISCGTTLIMIWAL